MKIGNKDRLYYSAYTGEDKFAFNERYNFSSQADQESYKSRFESGLDWGILFLLLDGIGNGIKSYLVI